jgi:putative CocE/NonD family hydrolase
VRKIVGGLLALCLTLLVVPAHAGTKASTSEPVCTRSNQYPSPSGALRHFCGYFPASTDGVKLAWQVYLPDPKKWGKGPYATVIDYSGYSPAATFYDGLGRTFVDQGYAVAGVNIRGTGCSGGAFDYFEPKEWKDGYDAVEFLAKRSWSSGDVAMVGKSYPGITPLFVAPQRPPHLRAIVPGAFFNDVYRDVAYPGGIQNTVFAAGFSLISQPGNTLDALQQGFIDQQDPVCIQNQAEHATNPATNPFVTLAAHPYDDASQYEARGPYAMASKVQVPVLAQLAWQDEELAARGIDYVNRLPKTTPWRAVLTNGDHGEYYDQFVKDEIFRFLSFYVKHQTPKGDPCQGTTRAALACYQGEPRVTVGNENGPDRTPSWISRYKTWPVATKALRLNLQADGGLSAAEPIADSKPVPYAYSSAAGSNSYGTVRGFQGRSPVDHDFWQDRPPAGTTAQFTTAPFTKPTMLVGNASLELWLTSTAADTDLEVMVTEIRPDGREQYVSKGWLRASQRKLDAAQSTVLRPYQTHQLADVQPLIPARATPMRVEVFPFAQLFRPGTRLRITIEAPTLAPEIWGFASLPLPASNQVFTDAAHPSSLALPFVDLPAGYRAPAERPCGSLRNQPCRPAQ